MLNISRRVLNGKSVSSQQHVQGFTGLARDVVVKEIEEVRRAKVLVKVLLGLFHRINRGQVNSFLKDLAPVNSLLNRAHR